MIIPNSYRKGLTPEENNAEEREAAFNDYFANYFNREEDCDCSNCKMREDCDSKAKPLKRGRGERDQTLAELAAELLKVV